MKKNRCLLLIFLIGFFTIAGLFINSNRRLFCIHSNNLVEAHHAVAKKINSNIDNITVLRLTKSNNFLLVLYKSNDEAPAIALAVFERTGLLPNRYSFKATTSFLNKDINTLSYRYTNTESKGFIAIFGQNTQLKAYSYMFTNSGNTCYSQIKNNYLIDVYFFDKMINACINGYLYNKSGEIISIL